eukprot:9028825-Karenia_brevis.AAC.1
MLQEVGAAEKPPRESEVSEGVPEGLNEMMSQVRNFERLKKKKGPVLNLRKDFLSCDHPISSPGQQ